MTVLFKNKLLKPLQVGLLLLQGNCHNHVKEISQEVVCVRKTKVAFSPLVLYLRAFGTFCLNKRLFFVIHEGVLTNKEVEQISIVGSMLWDV